MARNLAYYLALPYERVWESREDDGVYLLVSLKDIPRVCGSGRTAAEAEQHLTEAFQDYLAWRLDDRLPIPEPAVQSAHVGSLG